MSATIIKKKLVKLQSALNDKAEYSPYKNSALRNAVFKMERHMDRVRKMFVIDNVLTSTIDDLVYTLDDEHKLALRDGDTEKSTEIDRMIKGIRSTEKELFSKQT